MGSQFGDLCPGGSLSRGALFSGVSVWGSLSRGIPVPGGGVSVHGDPRTVMCGLLECILI